MKIRLKLFKGAVVVSVCVAMTTTTGCCYYKVTTYHNTHDRPGKFYEGLTSSFQPYKYVIIHRGNRLWHLNDMEVTIPPKRDFSQASAVLRGYLGPADSGYINYYNKYNQAQRRAVRYFAADEQFVADQVNVYLTEKDSINTGKLVTISSMSIDKIEKYKQASGRTGWTWSLLYMWFPQHKDKSHESNHADASPRQHGPRRN